MTFLNYRHCETELFFPKYRPSTYTSITAFLRYLPQKKERHQITLPEQPLPAAAVADAGPLDGCAPRLPEECQLRVLEEVPLLHVFGGEVFGCRPDLTHNNGHGCGADFNVTWTPTSLSPKENESHRTAGYVLCARHCTAIAKCTRYTAERSTTSTERTTQLHARTAGDDVCCQCCHPLQWRAQFYPTRESADYRFGKLTADSSLL